MGGMEITPPSSNSGNYEVVFPCDVKNFRAFVSGLLGKPKEMLVEVPGFYTIRRADISNIYHLINQRVSKQNNGGLIHFEIAVHYSDGTTVTHHNVGDFESYFPTTKCFPLEIGMTFIYLIHFAEVEAPEKQEIKINICTDADSAKYRTQGWFSSGIFAVKILHTERTWAADIAGLMRNHAEGIVDKASKIKLFFSRRSDDVVQLLTMAILFITIIVWATTTTTLLNTRSLLDPAGQKYLVVSVAAIGALALVLKLVTMMFERFVYLGESSYIILTDKDEARAAKDKKRNLWKYIIYFGSWLFAIANGLLTSYIYTSFSGN